MEPLLYGLARALIAVVRALPLGLVVRLGRTGGHLVFWLDARHRRVALENLRACYGAEKSPSQLRALVCENFKRIGESFAGAVKTSGMQPDAIRSILEFSGAAHLHSRPAQHTPPNCVCAIGHFGNFELYAWAGLFLDGYQCATTYRGLKQPALTQLLQSLRAQSGCLYFERRTDAVALRTAMNRGGLLLGLLSDQNAGGKGLSLSFLGRPCSTTAAPAVFALRYGCPLHTAICYRTALGRWRIELSPEIPTREDDQPRSLEAIMQDVNRAFETAVHRDPANWFWVHNRWKLAGSKRPRSRLSQTRKQ